MLAPIFLTVELLGLGPAEAGHWFRPSDGVSGNNPLGRITRFPDIGRGALFVHLSGAQTNPLPGSGPLAADWGPSYTEIVKSEAMEFAETALEFRD